MPALAYFDLGFPHELWSFSHLYYSDSTILKKNPITFQFLLIVFNSFWKPFQLFIIHFFLCSYSWAECGFFPCSVWVFSLLWLLWGCFQLGFPPSYSCVDLAGKCQCDVASEGAWENAPFVLCFQDYFLQPAPAHWCTFQHCRTTSQQFMSLHPELPSQLDWPVSPCSFLTGLRSMCCLKAVGSRTQNIFGGSWLPGQLQFQFLVVNSMDEFILIPVSAEIWRHTHPLQGWLALFNAFCSPCNHAVHAQITDLVFACIGAESNPISNQYLADLSKGCWVPLLQVCMGFAELGFVGGL